ncbi:MAG: hypothetical protein JO046_04700 [Solirubrobacterales bacterium]|nr:hypothetical protein [Solirubrobacterales bacterium]MBV9681066.1 hypothetical protein [Solirubrobacterales bacterium]
MMGHIGEAHIHRTSDRAAGRRPLRLEIGRRRAHTRAGAEKFVTEVRIGEATALVVPWREDRRALEPRLAQAA